MTDDRPRLIIITGPTASGKSSLAVDLAIELGGEIISADSMQVYRGMDIGTAKPTTKERRGVRHHLIDVVDPDEEFNASIFRSLAEAVIGGITARQKPCFLVGGTGLYIKTLLGGLFECPPTDPELRKKLFRECDEYGPSDLHQRLEKLDPESAQKIHPNDRARLIRALEVIALTDQPLSSLVQGHGFKENHFKTLKICLNMDRELLYHLINERSLRMMEAGLVAETKKLLEMGYSPELKPMKSLGYRHAVALLKRECDQDEMVRQLQTDTRRYAKRQLTWFRADPDIAWVAPEDKDLIKEKIRVFI
ncbi:MAG: tRNA (adenosine(37)-N6)-dimethylallyltransferase MiaA [Deltaproteobacteria bacterium]|nr:tRNA (adenosine(37)-N6)-dimethylallyltransferase MiaA [Deltaproteobacteria bacterium]